MLIAAHLGQAASSGPPVWITYTAAGISVLALSASIASLWQSHLAPLKLVTVAGMLTLRITPFRSDSRRWFVVDAVADFTFTNAGAQPGLIRDMRMRVDYPEAPVAQAYEYFSLAFEVDPQEYDKHAENRLEWCKNAVLNNGVPFILLPKQSQQKKLVFSRRWEQPVIQRTVLLTLEVYSERSRKWLSCDSWLQYLTEDNWIRLANENGVSNAYPGKGYVRHDETHPSDLHEYTGSEKDLTAGRTTPWQSSYIDYPESPEQS